MKKLFKLMLCGLVVFSLGACDPDIFGGEDTEDKTEQPEDNVPNTGEGEGEGNTGEGEGGNTGEGGNIGEGEDDAIVGYNPEVLTKYYWLNVYYEEWEYEDGELVWSESEEYDPDFFTINYFADNKRVYQYDGAEIEGHKYVSDDVFDWSAWTLENKTLTLTDEYDGEVYEEIYKVRTLTDKVAPVLEIAMLDNFVDEIEPGITVNIRYEMLCHMNGLSKDDFTIVNSSMFPDGWGEDEEDLPSESVGVEVSNDESGTRSIIRAKYLYRPRVRLR